MALTVLAWVLRAVATVALVYSALGLLYGLKVGKLLRGGTEVVQPPRMRALQGLGFLILAVATWLLAGVLQGDMESGFAVLMGAAGAAGAMAGLLRRDVRRRMPPRPPDHLNAVEVVSWILLFVAIGAGGAISERVPGDLRQHLVWGALVFGIFAGGTFIAWAIARLWLRLRRSPTPQPPSRVL